MTVRLDAWTDYTCPFCFLATLSLERLQQDTQAELHWRAFLLRPAQAPLAPEVHAMVEKEHVRVKELARSQHGLALNPGPIGIGTREAHLVTKYAASHYRGNEFHFAAMKAYWLEGRSLEDQSVLQDIAEQVGLNREGVLEALENRSLAAAVDADRMQAANREISGVPAVVFNSKYILAGAQPYAVFKRLHDQVRDQAREAELRHTQRRAQAGD